MKTSVALARCASYATPSVEEAVRRLLAALGGMGRFVRRGQRVLLKPNLLTDRVPDDGITTHPEVVRAVIRLVRQEGADCVVGDSPASVFKLERVWERTGFKRMCGEEAVPLVELERDGGESRTVDGFSFSVSRAVLQADVVIGIPKVKTHVLTVLTGGVKNMYGCVPGLQKTGLHKRYYGPPFDRLIAAVYSTVRPALVVADAVVGMEGNGPSSGALVDLGFLAAAGDGAALDAMLCEVLGIDPRAVRHLGAVARLAAGVTDRREIEVLGDPVADVKPRRFAVPNTFRSRALPGGLLRLFGRYFWTRPAFGTACVRCGLCVQACPVGALTLPREAPHPRLNANACVECCCCHEVCPKRAVTMGMSALYRLVHRHHAILR